MTKKRARAVIGANYGDEGKGLVVDHLCWREPPGVVVRANGGAQAGHTVCAPDGRRHVFHHIGAGAFLGVPTFLSRFFICNPILFLKEHAELGALGVSAKVLVDHRCLVTTPWDMLLNQAAEDRRGDGRHGSCGVGINETVERSADPAYRITVGDLAGCGRDIIRDRLLHLRDRHCRARAREVGDHSLCDDEVMANDGVLERWMLDVERFVDSISLVGQNHLPLGDGLLFEGAQGLALSQDNIAGFPHLTRSFTGLRNPLRLCEELGIDDLHVTYVTRTYLTRHGAGPLPGESSGVPIKPTQDNTNVPHPYQGALRVAPLDATRLQYRIEKDMSLGRGSPVSQRSSVAVTHCDELANCWGFQLNGGVSLEFGGAVGRCVA